METILIISDKNELSTDDVLDWIFYKNPTQHVVRICEHDKITVKQFEIVHGKVSFTLEIDFHDGSNTTFSSNSIQSFWYRRGRLNFKHKYPSPQNPLQYNFWKATAEYVDSELQYIEDEINDFLFRSKKSLNKFKDNETNKIHNLQVALRHGLDVPNSIVTSNREVLKNFCKNSNGVMIKPIKSPTKRFHVNKEEYFLSIDNHFLKTSDIDTVILEDNFEPTLCQEYIEKKFEIRSFFLDGSFYSMAIFSQQNEKTKYDFRKYDYSRPNRTVPFKLPHRIESSLKNVMQELGMKSGSFDLIYTPKGDFVFLEVNPVGQFQWLSKGCNFYIEKKLAEYFLNQHDGR